MKHGRKPTRAQSARIKSLNLNPEHWLVTKDSPDCFEIVHRASGVVKRKESPQRQLRAKEKYTSILYHKGEGHGKEQKATEGST